MNYPEKKRILKLARFTQKIQTEFLKGVSPNQLIYKLKKKEIDVVVDIRWWSVYPVYFAPLNLRFLLTKNDIEYLRLQALGNPSILRKQAGENFELAKEWYLEYIIKDPKARQMLLDLLKKLRFRKNYCLICYHRTLDPRLCHRFWLKEALINAKRISLGFEGTYKIECYYESPIPEVMK